MAPQSCGPGSPFRGSLLFFVWIFILLLVTDLKYTNGEKTKNCKYLKKIKFSIFFTIMYTIYNLGGKFVFIWRLTMDHIYIRKR